MWWLAGCGWLDEVPPTLSVSGPGGTVRAAELVVTVRDEEPGLARLEVSIDDQAPVALEVPANGVVPWVLPDLHDGPHVIRFRAVDAAWRPNEARAEHTLTLDRTPPLVELYPAVAGQGRTLAVWVRSPEVLVDPIARVSVDPEGGEGEPVEVVMPLHPVAGVYRALRGVPIEATVGPHSLVVEARDALGNVERLESTYEVTATEFEQGGFIRLTPKQKAARKDEEAIRTMRAERNAAYAKDLDPAWTGVFQLPVADAEFTSPFGKYRTYSDGKKSHHVGLDLSQKRGVPVMAAADGMVLVAHEQAIFGNVVVVNHGHHVATSYNHLDSIAVQEGERVVAGQVVGTLGATGQSTGPHLHWGLEVDVVAVDPAEWLGNAFSTPPWSAMPPPARLRAVVLPDSSALD